MQKKLKDSGIITGILLPIAILCIFVFVSLTLALYSGNVYQNLRNTSTESFGMSTAGSYIQNRVFQNNRVGAFSISMQGDIQVLTIQIPTQEGSYESRIFAYDGYLMEHFTSTSAPFNTSEATIITPMQNCNFTLTENNLLLVELVNHDHLHARVPIHLVQGAML